MYFEGFFIKENAPCLKCVIRHLKNLARVPAPYENSLRGLYHSAAEDVPREAALLSDLSVGKKNGGRQYLEVRIIIPLYAKTGGHICGKYL